jgi:hypothetical protein
MAMLADFDYYVGKTFKFCGVDHNRFKLDDTVWEAIEDPNDGYRSSLGSVQVTESQDNLIFSSVPLATVKIVSYKGPMGKDNDYDYVWREKDVYQLVDVVDGHIWLEFGTEDIDDYYPGFSFHYQPKAIPAVAETSKPSSIYNMKEGD